MTDEDVVADVNALADEGMGGNLAAAPDGGATLNLHETADFRVVADAAAVKIDEIEPADVAPDLNVMDDVTLGFDRQSLIGATH